MGKNVHSGKKAKTEEHNENINVFLDSNKEM